MENRRKLMSYDEFIKTYGLAEINTLAREYLRPGATTKSVSSKYKISEKTFRMLIDFGVVECHIQKSFIPLMEEKSRRNQVRHLPEYVSPTKKTQTEERYQRLKRERKVFIHKYDEEIINLHYMIESYNDFGFEEEGAVPKSSLLRRLDELESRRAKLESF